MTEHPFDKCVENRLRNYETVTEVPFAEELPTAKKDENIVIYQSLLTLFDSLNLKERVEVLEIVTLLRDLDERDRQFVAATVAFLTNRRA